MAERSAEPFGFNTPEKIATEYGGNKQSIAQAAQLGVIDPTVAVLAGMFIDKMRAAQVQEQQPQMTVAQQVFAPPPVAMPQQGAPGGLPAAPPQAGPMAMPPMPRPAAPPMPPPQAPVMAARGGLAELPIPDDMFDDGENEYAGGGLVAFQSGGVANSYGGMTVAQLNSIINNPNTSMAEKQLATQELAKLSPYLAQLSGIQASMPPRPLSEYMAEQEEALQGLERPQPTYLADLVSGLAEQKKFDKNFALAQMGFGIAEAASQPGASFLTSLSGAAKALPGMQEAARDLRARQAALAEAQYRNEADIYRDARDQRLAGLEAFRAGRSDTERLAEAATTADIESRNAAAQRANAQAVAETYVNAPTEYQKNVQYFIDKGMSLENALAAVDRLDFTDAQREVEAEIAALRADPANTGKSDEELRIMAYNNTAARNRRPLTEEERTTARLELVAAVFDAAGPEGRRGYEQLIAEGDSVGAAKYLDDLISQYTGELGDEWSLISAESPP